MLRADSRMLCDVSDGKLGFLGYLVVVASLI